ncbi:hypothetical protein BBJ28_00010028 [Nothophytophthora sp. Chile5]|nr:hypothetical protein BBJ28_00010028 [Nothophytophthora sp. Chile5]
MQQSQASCAFPLLASVRALSRYCLPDVELPHVTHSLDALLDDFSSNLTIAESYKRTDSLRFMQYIAARGSKEAMDPFYRRWMFNIVTELAAAAGDLAALQWMMESYQPDEFLTKAVAAAAANGHLHILKWLYEQHKERGYWGGTELCGAMENNHKDVIDWLRKHAAPHADSLKKVMEVAATTGNVGVVEWLFKELHESVEDALWSAQSGCQWDTAQWILEHCKLKRPWIDWDLPAKDGALPFLQYLRSRSIGGPGYYTIQVAAWNGHLEVLPSPPKQRKKNKMPFLHVSSNVPKANVDANAAIRALSKSISDALDRPEPHVMVQLDLEQHMLFQASDAPCAFVQIRSIGRIDSVKNPKTAEAVTATVAQVLNVPADRVFLNLNDIASNNWAFDGKVAPTEKEPNPPAYRMKLFAPNQVLAQSRFWYFLHQMKKMKKTTGEILDISEVRLLPLRRQQPLLCKPIQKQQTHRDEGARGGPQRQRKPAEFGDVSQARSLTFSLLNVSLLQLTEKNRRVVNNYGVWIRYNSRSGTHNMYKEYRDVTLCKAVEQMYSELAGRHRARPRSIQIMRTAIVAAKDTKKTNVQQFHDSKIQFPLSHRLPRAAEKHHRTVFKASRPCTFRG